MTFSVYQHWDPLKVMIVGKSYPPEVYDYIKNEKVRKVFYRIAEETEEDYQKLINLLTSLGVKVIRVNNDVSVDMAKRCGSAKVTLPRPLEMQPCDNTIMLGKTFYYTGPIGRSLQEAIDLLKAEGNEVLNTALITGFKSDRGPVYMNRAMTARLGKDLIMGSVGDHKVENLKEVEQAMQLKLPDYRVHMADTAGHADGTFCPVVPGLLLSITGDYEYYKTLFPNWEVVYLEGESWSKMIEWDKLKSKNRGKWWVPGEELNDDFTHYVEQWMDHWVGYVEESVFDVNMIVVDQKNVIVNGYNKAAFDAFSRRGITAHICNFRHRYFWDGGLHCITSDIHREGVMTDWFPERSVS